MQTPRHHVNLQRLPARRAWRGLLLAAFFNMESDLYYELFSGWMGKGDKESFAHALAATRTPFSLVTTPVGSVGLTGLVRALPCSLPRPSLPMPALKGLKCTA